MGWIYDRDNKGWIFIGSKEFHDEFKKVVDEYVESINKKTKKKKYGKSNYDFESGEE
jgi:hypothetical protein